MHQIGDQVLSVYGPRKTEKERHLLTGEGRSQIIWRRLSLVLYNSFNTLSCRWSASKMRKGLRWRLKVLCPQVLLTVDFPCSSVADPGCLSRIPDPTFFHPGPRIRTVSIPDPGSSSKNVSILTPKKAKKWFLSSKKYDPGCSSRIPDPDANFLPSRIPDPGVKKAPNPGSRIRNTALQNSNNSER